MKIIYFFVSFKKAIIFAFPIWEISSAGSEHLPYKQGVTGSNPVSPTGIKRVLSVIV